MSPLASDLLADLSLILILASGSKGQSWNVNVTRDIFAEPGSDVIVPCVFTYPSQFYTDDVQVYWKIVQKSQFVLNDLDKNTFVYHTNDTWVMERYRGKTSIIGNKDEGNCSLKIRDVDHNETSLYLRVVAKGQRYSFWNKSVSVTLLNLRHVALNESNAENAIQRKPPYIVIAGTVAMVLMIISFLGAFLVFKHKRVFQGSVSITGEAFGHSKRFRRRSANHANSCKPPEENFTDDPVYVNMKFRSDRMQPMVDHVENIYANIQM